MSLDVGKDQVIQLTYPGTAALAAVRIRGLHAKGLVARHFDRALEPGRCVYGRWREDDGEVLDDVVVVAGDGWFDVNLHGGRRIVAKLLEQAQAEGFAVITGDASIDAAAEDDIEAWLPRATTEAGLRMLLAQPAAWRALDPANVDVERLLNDKTLRRLLVPATVAIIGAPNAGKSTLANALFGQERAIVADIPGTTRDWVGGLADLNGVPVVLIDTPGRRSTSDAIEREAIELSEGPVASADVVVLLMDATRPADVPETPATFAARLNDETCGEPRASGQVLQVANKCDLADAPPGCLGISAKTGAGLDALVEAIHARLGVDVSGAHRAILANLFNYAQETLLRQGGARAVTQIAHRLGKG